MQRKMAEGVRGKEARVRREEARGEPREEEKEDRSHSKAVVTFIISFTREEEESG